MPLNSSGLPCAHQLDYPCLEFEVCFNMTGRGIHTGICMLLRTRMLQKNYCLCKWWNFLTNLLIFTILLCSIHTIRNVKDIFFVFLIKDINFDLRGDNSMTNSRILINGNESSFRVEDYLLNGTGTTCKNFTGQVEVLFLLFYILSIFFFCVACIS